MMDIEIISQELNSSKFVLKTQQQIIKDFSTTGIDFSDDFRSVPLIVERIIALLAEKLKEVETLNPRALSQLLYQIDIPESILSELAQTDDFHSGLAEIVLKREAYKVYLRSKFSS